ncbi:sensor domain-containing diguanylate cyclase, partial [Microvirga roseola]|uniref:sensor domain-containing diguanylate cyclase n=1 Tax=Microvirga roseola TaxID=2883126 RepID=UPI001E527A6E
MTAFARIRPTSSARGLKAFVVVVCLVILGLEGWRDWSEREQEFANIQSKTLNLAKSLAQHVEDTFEVADALLVDIVDRVEKGGTSPRAVERMDALLAERVQSLQRIKAISIFDEDGLLLSSSLPGHRGRVSGRNIAFFEHHRASRSEGWFFGPLIPDPLGSEWVLTLSRRISNPDGSFGGVVQASIPPRYFANFFGRFDVGTQGTIALFHLNGTLLSRYPYSDRAIGSNSAYEPWFTNGTTSGSYEYRSPIDGTVRLGGYQRNHIFPIGVLASVGREEALAHWTQAFLLRTVVVVLLVVTIGGLGWSLAGELRRREIAEGELAILAGTDSLTSLANRRTFDRQLAIEWVRSSRRGSPLSLLLVDVDRFKCYNDIYGHQAGDECLRKVADSLSKTMEGPSTLVARYGGEEFAVLLADTDEAEAAEAAETVRRQIEALALRHDANAPSGILTISVGSATLTPGIFSSEKLADELIAMADRALYRAKLEGRNRVSVAGGG